MSVHIFPPRSSRWLSVLVLAGAALLALGITRDQIGGWNDASRLATVECLGDYRTLAIDNSIYVDSRHAPRPPAPRGLLDNGTLDKLRVGGHFYSDKSPVPALLMAGVYRVWQGWSGLTARDCPERFVWWMTWTSSGLAFVLAVWCVFRLSGSLDLPPPSRFALTASFALATVAPVYAQQVNNHILLLAVLAGLLLGLVELAATPCWSRVAILGFLAGLGYTIDLGAGPIILVGVGMLAGYRCRSFGSAAVFVLAALPWLVLHHAVNYAVGGTFVPANAVPEYLNWPGSPFQPGNMTGVWNHPSAGRFLVYALDLLVGKRGFLGHNLPLFLAVVGVFVLGRGRPGEWPEILFAAGCAGAVWLVYAAGSNNFSGLCCSVRWLVPLLAPGYFVLAVLLRDHAEWRPDFLILSGWGMALTAVMVFQGPWALHMVPGYWFFQTAALLTWTGYRLRRWIAKAAPRQYDQQSVDRPIGGDEDQADVLPSVSRPELVAVRVRLWDAGSFAKPAENRAVGEPCHDSGEGRSPESSSEEAARAERR